MVTATFALTLAMAFIFMLYVLANFHFETKRPRQRAPRNYKRVIAFRAAPLQVAAPITAPRDRQAGSSTDQNAKERLLPTVLPIGVRRLAAKRAPRS